MLVEMRGNIRNSIPQYASQGRDGIAWGEKRHEAMELIELACQKHPDVTTAEALVGLVYRLKQGVEV